MPMRLRVLPAASLALATVAIPARDGGCAAWTELARCSCVPGAQTVAQAAASAAIVITGVVHKVERPSPRDPRGLVRVTVHARAKWRGTSTDSVFTIVTGVGGGDCGYAFEVDREYVIFASATAVTSEYYTGICSRTRDAKSAEADVAALGTPPIVYRWSP